VIAAKLATPTTERSMPPVIMHSITPSAIRPNSGNCAPIVWNEMAVKNLPNLKIAMKVSQIAVSATSRTMCTSPRSSFFIPFIAEPPLPRGARPPAKPAGR